MLLRTPLAVLGALVCLALPLAAQQRAVTEQDYRKAMTETQLLISDANLHIDSSTQDFTWPDLQEDARKIRAQLTIVERFWTARGTKDAIAFARSAAQAVRPLEAAATKRDAQAARSAVSALLVTCENCHKQFREKTATGFRIKP